MENIIRNGRVWVKVTHIAYELFVIDGIELCQRTPTGMEEIRDEGILDACLAFGMDVYMNGGEVDHA